MITNRDEHRLKQIVKARFSQPCVVIARTQFVGLKRVYKDLTIERLTEIVCALKGEIR